MTVFSEVLSAQLRRDPGRPLVTFYDGESGERTELSVTTYANWVAKAASLLVDEIGLDRGDSLRVDLPPHWLGPVLLGAAWTAGLRVTGTADPDVVVCGPASLATWADRSAGAAGGGPTVLASALLPLGVRFPEGVPDGVLDLGVEIWSQPDAFVPVDPPSADDVAHDLGGVAVSHDELWTAAAAGSLLTDGGRLLTVANPASPPGIATVTEPLLRGGSLVLVARAGRELLETTYAAERATARFPA